MAAIETYLLVCFVIGILGFGHGVTSDLNDLFNYNLHGVTYLLGGLLISALIQIFVDTKLKGGNEKHERD